MQGCSFAASIVIGCVLMAVVAASSDRWPGGVRELVQLIALAGPPTLVFLFFNSAERRKARRDPATWVSGVATEFRAEMDDAGDDRRPATLEVRLRQHELAMRLAPDHPETRRLGELVREAETRPGDAHHEEGTGAIARGFWSLFFASRQPIDRGARVIWAIGVLMIVAALGTPWFWFVLPGLLGTWAAGAILLRRHSRVVSVGGGFLFAMVHLAILGAVFLIMRSIVEHAMKF